MNKIIEGQEKLYGKWKWISHRRIEKFWNLRNHQIGLCFYWTWKPLVIGLGVTNDFDRSDGHFGYRWQNRFKIQAGLIRVIVFTQRFADNT